MVLLAFFMKNNSYKLKSYQLEQFFKIFIRKKKSLKDNLKLQSAQLDGSEVKTSDKKIHDFSITKLGKRKKT